MSVNGWVLDRLVVIVADSICHRQTLPEMEGTLEQGVERWQSECCHQIPPLPYKRCAAPAAATAAAAAGQDGSAAVGTAASP